MHVYRLSQRIFADDLLGAGARLHGGRWNHKGIPCIYTGTSRALCICEYAANVSSDNLPNDLAMVTFEIPEHSVLNLEINQLPKNWREDPSPFENKKLGSKILIKNEFLIIRIPSTIVPQEYNYILNPVHKNFEKVKIVDIMNFNFDIRIKS